MASASEDQTDQIMDQTDSAQSTDESRRNSTDISALQVTKTLLPIYNWAESVRIAYEFIII